MAVSLLLENSSQKKYTPSFLSQLNSEWNEFMLEISHSTPQELSGGATVSQPIPNVQGELVNSLNNLRISSDSNIVIPVPLNALKKLFSPTRLDADDAFKNEFFNEIKDNLHLNELECKKLQRLLFPDLESSNEISDFPSPSLPSNFRKSAPPRLISKKMKSLKSQQKNDVLRILNCFNNDNDKNLQKQNLDVVNENRCLPIASQNIDGNPLSKSFIRTADKISQRVPDSEAGFSNMKTPVISSQKPPQSEQKGSRKKKLQLSKKTQNRESQTSKRSRSKDAQKSAETSTQKRSRSKDSSSRSQTQNKKQEQKRYSSIYDLELDEGEDSSSDLFYTMKSCSKKRVLPTIVCTYFSQIELARIYQVVKKLGHFEIENNVSSRTTHLICGSSNKTMNLCKAVARGCWVLDKKWVLMSAKEGRWLFEERFEKTDICPAIKKNRLQRQILGLTYECEVFSQCGSMFVSKSCIQPSVDDIKILIALGGGKLVEKPDQASYIIGSMSNRKFIKEIWILNCILQGYIVDVNKYIRQ